MVQYRYPSGRRVQRKNPRNLFLTAALVAISMSPVAFYAKLQGQDTLPPSSSRSMDVAAPAAPVQAAPATVAAESAAESTGNDTAWSPVDPAPMLKPEALAFTRNAPLATTFRRFGETSTAAAQTPVPPTREIAQVQETAQVRETAQVQESAQGQESAPGPQLAQAAQPVPLPVPRPAEFQVAKALAPLRPETPRAARAPLAAPMQVAAASGAQEGSPNFIEKLFGIKPARPPENALSYAALESGNAALGSSLNAVPGDGTAVYDISAKVVIMPNGERLEAHSGLGDKLDDPRFVHVRMRGPTPPGTYLLREREALFHGVRAIRLTPVGGSAAIHGRDGILAHTYMLGPNGDSNGCVSFRNYDRFLQAYLRGEVKRLVVVAGRGQDALPRMVGRGRTS
ncbi:DUF2778 domain-containing protein [Microvirga sp. TS319]|uniref:DUF2778 domain-containing protein n=1 Tax=Microvirga sp. TS319 TaxID=3241165 RepID=UPI00351A0FDF